MSAADRIPPFAALRAFAAVGEAGGIRKAAQALSISHAAVSRHVSALEADVGAQLLDRRSGQLTEAGREYYVRINTAIADMKSATETLRKWHGQRLNIWCSEGFSLHWLTRQLSDFPVRTGWPSIDLLATSKVPDLEMGEADGDIRYCHDWAIETSDNVVSKELVRPSVFPVASPKLLEKLNRRIVTISDILALPLIQEKSAHEWEHWLEAQNAGAFQLPPPVTRFEQVHIALAAARSGMGVALANGFLVSEDLAEGKLIKIVPEAEPMDEARIGAYFFRYSKKKSGDAKIIQFHKWLSKLIQSA